MKSIMKNNLLTLSCLTLSFSAFSADLSEIFKQSENHDPQLSAAKYTLDASSEGKKQAFSAFLPQVNATVSGSESDTNGETAKGGLTLPFTNESKSRGWNVGLTQSIYDHSNYQNYKISELQVLQSTADYDIAYQEFVLRVAQTYFNVLAAKDNLLFSQAEEKAIQRQLDQAEQRFEVGLAAITDVHESRARFDNSRASVILAKNQLEDANEALFEISQKYYDEISPVPNDVNYNTFVLDTLDSYQEKGLALNPELISSEINRDIAEKTIKLRKSGHYPTLSLNVSRSDNTRPNTTSTQIDFNTGFPVEFESGKQTSDSNSISLTLNVPIYSGGRTSSQVRQSAHQHSAALDRYEQTRRGTIRSIRNNYNGTRAAKSTVEARKQAMVSAQSGLEATEAGYEVGTRTIVDVLNSQGSLYQAQRDYSRAKYDYFIQYLGIKRAVGNLSVEDINTINSVLMH
jgi:outer membrane protein